MAFWYVSGFGGKAWHGDMMRFFQCVDVQDTWQEWHSHYWDPLNDTIPETSPPGGATRVLDSGTQILHRNAQGADFILLLMLINLLPQSLKLRRQNCT